MPINKRKTVQVGILIKSKLNVKKYHLNTVSTKIKYKLNVPIGAFIVYIYKYVLNALFIKIC